MLAVRAHQGSTDIHLESVPIPAPGPQDVLIKVASAGLVPGPIKMLERGRLRLLPTILGHEVAGTIHAVGSEVDSSKVGDRVRMHPNLTCRKCKHCLNDREQMCNQAAIIGFNGFGKAKMPLYEQYHDGGLAEYMVVPHWLVDKLPENVSFDVAAKVHDVGSAMRAIKCANLEPDSTIVVTAPTGAMGTSILKLAEHFAIRRVILIGRSRERLEAVRHLTKVSTDIVVLEELDPDWVSTKGLKQKLLELAPDGLDAILDFMPSGQDIWQSMGALATNGTLVHMGGNVATLPYPVAIMMFNCWKFVGTRGNTRSDTDQVLRWLADGRLNVDDLITHKYKLSEVREGITDLQSRASPIWMSVVNI